MDIDGNSPPFFQQLNGPSPSVQTPLPSTILPPLNDDADALNLRHLLSVARRRIFVFAGVSIAVACGVLVKVLTQTPIYEGNFRLLVEPIKGQNNLEQLNQTLTQNIGKGENLDYETQIEVLLSNPVINPIFNNIQQNHPDFEPSEFTKNLNIRRLKLTKILDIRYQDTDAEKIKTVLKQLASGYIHYSEMEQQTTLRQGLEFVETQLPRLQQRVDTLQEYLEEFRQHYNLIDPEQSGQILSQQIGSLVKERQETESQLVQAQALYGKLRGQLGLELEQAMLASSLSEAPRYQDLLNRFHEIEAKLARESTRFTVQSPAMQALIDERNSLLPLLQEEALLVLGPNVSQVRGDIRGLSTPNSLRSDLTGKLIETVNLIEMTRARQWAIAQGETIVQQQMQEQATLMRQYTDLQRELELGTESLNRFLAVRENLQIESAQKAMPWQLISQPEVGPNPISPNLPRSLLLGVIAGLMAGIWAALLAEKLDTKFHSVADIKDYIGFPILGTIPFEKDLKENLTVSDGENLVQSSGGYLFSRFFEAFRSLHADLYFMSPDRPLKSIVISSTLPAEGKTTISIKLAEAASAMGNRVLLVDADLRRPQIDRRMDLPNVWGLSNLISTDSLNAQDSIQQSALNQNLYVLTAGQMPPDPARLLSSQRMKQLIEEFKTSFDLVIFDTPPLGAISDAKFLAPHTDGLVMVIGMGKSDRAILREVFDGLKMSRTPILGLVANGVKQYLPTSYNYYERYYAPDETRVHSQ
ncbi:polysaccharide biosynthesis tyrosine autokinase [Phormidium pseudopriestleyi FRX01]|uniref:non-specific protein-tyrosine kinase n=1 Tax=Phormidium pseudopriestleyi FRX01 TaxID=1759528 RepID=A0ABS3FMF9_9CYAN|nr:polysaccharide biosynthesis tyrosine autokinase [Phormidium pseudopriestleyi]MBO0347846.1 polysaccharide biosynthesis tyrosine autokinase [Phormidium pseudopriestleyi FRX01]